MKRLAIAIAALLAVVGGFATPASAAAARTGGSVTPGTRYSATASPHANGNFVLPLASSSKTLTIVRQVQSKDDYCVEAVSRAIISVWKPTGLPSQDVIAGKEGYPAPGGGTYYNKVPAAVDSYAPPANFTDTTYSNTTDYYNMIKTAVDKNHGVLSGVDPYYLPWYAGTGVGHSNHAILTYGYSYATKTVTNYVWDPEGTANHTVSAITVYDAAQGGNGTGNVSIETVH